MRFPIPTAPLLLLVLMLCAPAWAKPAGTECGQVLLASLDAVMDSLALNGEAAEAASQARAAMADVRAILETSRD